MEENNKEFVKKYISAYESLSINNLDTLKNTFTNDIEFEDEVIMYYLEKIKKDLLLQIFGRNHYLINS